MNNDIKKRMKAILDSYIETNHFRHTPERYAILDTVCDIRGHFTIEQLSNKLADVNFIVSRATLYNTLKLFIKLRIIVRHKLPTGTRYELCDVANNHCHQICTVCGKVKELKSQIVIDAVNNTKLSRFRKEGFALYIYGICSSCMAKNTRNKTLMEHHKSNTKK